MDSPNHMCDEGNCGLFAVSFTLRQSVKQKWCQTHIIDRIKKGWATFPIAAYEIINLPEDAMIYESRRNVVEVGLGHLSVLESRCETELAEAQNAIQNEKLKMVKLVESCYERMKQQVREKYQETKENLEKAKQNLIEFSHRREAELLETTQAICKMNASLLRVALSDCSLPVATVITKGWKMAVDFVAAAVECMNETKKIQIIKEVVDYAEAQVRSGSVEYAREAIQYAKNIGFQGSDGNIKAAVKMNRRRVAQQMIILLQNSVDIEEVKTIAFGHLEEGIEAKAAYRYKECHQSLNQAWTLLRAHSIKDSLTARVGLALGEVLCFYFAEYAETEAIIKECLEIEYAPASEVALRLHILQAGVFFSSDQDDNLESVCVRILENLSQANHEAELIWTTLFYLSYSYYRNKNKKKEEALVAEWLSKPLRNETGFTQLLKLSVRAFLAKLNNDLQESERLRMEARSTAPSSTSIHAAINLYFLAWLYRDANRLKESESMYVEAERIFATHFPHNIWTARNLVIFGIVYQELNRKEDALNKHEEAHRIFSLKYPTNLSTAQNLTWMADALET